MLLLTFESSQFLEQLWVANVYSCCGITFFSFLLSSQKLLRRSEETRAQTWLTIPPAGVNIAALLTNYCRTNTSLEMTDVQKAVVKASVIKEMDGRFVAYVSAGAGVK